MFNSLTSIAQSVMDVIDVTVVETWDKSLYCVTLNRPPGTLPADIIWQCR